MIREAVRGTDDDLVIFCGSGAAAAVVTTLIGILELRIPAGLDERFGFSGQIPGSERRRQWPASRPPWSVRSRYSLEITAGRTACSRT
jgi:hypothetical protein